jgi:hypothetical protein
VPPRRPRRRARRRDSRFDEGRHVGQVGPARAARDRERPQPAVPGERRENGEAVDGPLRGAGKEVGDRGRRALVGDVDDLDASLVLEQRAQEIGRGGEARAVVQLAGIGLRVGHELRHRARGQVGADHEQVRQDRHHRHRGERAHRVVVEIGVARGRHRERARRSEQERVAVGLRGRAGADGAAAKKLEPVRLLAD